MLDRKFRRLLTAAVVYVGWLAAPGGADAQWVLEKTTQRWIGGETVELYLPKQEGQQAIYVDAVLFDGRPIAFETVELRSDNEAYRVRAVIPQEIAPGTHAISVQFSDTAFEPVPDLRGLTLDEAQRRIAATGLTLDPGALSAGTSDAGELRITRQQPAAGTPVATGTRIQVGFAAQAGVPDAPGTRAPVAVADEVPEVTGERIDAARRILIESGFTPAVVIREAADGPYETVLTQRPAAGEPAPSGSVVEIVIESLPDPPGPRWPWVLLAAAGLLSGLLVRGRMKRRRRATRGRYRVEAHNDLDRLLEGTTPPAWQSPELRLDIRLRSLVDPGRQTLTADAPLIEETR